MTKFVSAWGPLKLEGIPWALLGVSGSVWQFSYFQIGRVLLYGQVCTFCFYSPFYLSPSLPQLSLLFLSESLSCISILSASLLSDSHISDPCLKGDVSLVLDPKKFPSHSWEICCSTAWSLACGIWSLRQNPSAEPSSSSFLRSAVDLSEYE